MANESRAIKIVYLTTVPESLPFYSDQIQYMKGRGFEVYAVSSPGVWLDKFSMNEQVSAHAVDMPRRITPWRDVVAVFQLVKILRLIQPQIVYASTPKGGLLGMIAAWLARVPIRIYSVLGLPFMTALGLKYHLLTWSEQVACRLADEVFSVSHSVREVVIDRNLCPAHKVKVLANGSVNGIDTIGRFNPERLDAQFREQMRTYYRIPSEAIVVGFIGRRVRDKGIIELAEAWRTVREVQPNAYLLVVGPSEPQDPVPREVEDALARDPRVRITGFVDDILTVYAVMDVLTLPTYREGFPISLLEAAALELPVVATRVTGCIDAVIDGVTGTLVPTYDARQLAQAIAAYLDRSELRTQHGQAARLRVLHEFRPEAILEATYAEFTRLLKEKALPIPSSRRTEYSA